VQRAERERVTELAPGDVLGRYQLLLPIAAGGMGRVWAARQIGQRGIRKLVAVKTALAEYARRPEFETLFMDEARIACALEHPNACRVLEVGDDDGVLFLAMEWVGGGSLRDLLVASPEKRLEPRVAARIVAQACAGLHAAHELRDDSGAHLGVVHRDVSPHNLLLTVDGHVKIADFGVVRARNQGHDTTLTGELKGKVSYMAPEQLSTRAYDRRADVFSLGCVLYEALVGEKAFDGEPVLALYRIMEGQFAPPRTVVPNIDEDLERIVLRALERDPEQRFASAEDMRLALERWLAGVGELCTESDVAAVIRAHLGVKNEERAAAIRAAESRVGSPDALRVSGTHIGGATLSGSPSEPLSGRRSAPTPVSGPHVDVSEVPRTDATPVSAVLARPHGRTSRFALGAALVLAIVVGGGTSLLRMTRGGDEDAPGSATRAAETAENDPQGTALLGPNANDDGARRDRVALGEPTPTANELGGAAATPTDAPRSAGADPAPASARIPQAAAPKRGLPSAGPAPRATKPTADPARDRPIATPEPTATGMSTPPRAQTGRPRKPIDSTDPFED
jgi:serine/threonine-protein kinase